jgi:thiamine pyrophosphate-dependent acetolactate synthase large subunit-like protein
MSPNEPDLRHNRPAATKHDAKVMNRFELTTRLVAKLKNEEAVIGGIGHSNFDLWGAGHRPQNFYMLGSMGLAGPIALGVALAQPKRRVFALEGDGSMLMQLGSLATIANVAPRNLTIIVWDNGMYHITGSQVTATAGRADLVEIARGAGIAQSAWASDEEDFERLVERSLNEDGPWFIAARIDATAPKKQTPREPVIIKDNFMRGIGAKPAS